MGEAGYSTLMSGKWHVDGTPPKRGFDNYFGFLSGAINFFTGKDWQSGENLMRLGEEVYDAPNDLAEKRPIVTERLARQYDVWAKRAGAKNHERSKKMKPSDQSQLFDLSNR